MALNTPSPRQPNPATSSLQSIAKALAEFDTELESERAEVLHLKDEQASLQIQVELLRSERASLTQEIKDLVEKKLLLQENINLRLLGQVSTMSVMSSPDTLSSRRASSKSSDYKNLFRATLTARGFYSSQSSDSSATSVSRKSLPATARQSSTGTGDQPVADGGFIAKEETVEFGTFGPIMNAGGVVDAGEPALLGRGPIMEAVSHVKSEIIALLSDGEEDEDKEKTRNRETELLQDDDHSESSIDVHHAEEPSDTLDVSTDLLPDSEDDDIISRKPKRKYRKSDCVDTPDAPPAWGLSIMGSWPSGTGYEDAWAAWRSNLLSDTSPQHRPKRRDTRPATRPV